MVTMLQAPQLGAPMTMFAPQQPLFAPMAGSQVSAPSIIPNLGRMNLAGIPAPPTHNFQTDPQQGGFGLPSSPGLKFSGFPSLGMQNPSYFTAPPNAAGGEDSAQQQATYAPPTMQAPAFTFLNNFDFVATTEPAAPTSAPYSARYSAPFSASVGAADNAATSTALPSGYQDMGATIGSVTPARGGAFESKYTAPTQAPRGHESPNRGYDPEDNGTRILTDGLRDVPTQLGSLQPLGKKQTDSVAQLGNGGSDDPNRIPTFVKVRGLPSSQDPRIVARKKSKKPKKSMCGCRALSLF